MKIEAISLLEHDSILESNDVLAKSEAVQSNELELGILFTEITTQEVLFMKWHMLDRCNIRHGDLYTCRHF